MTTDDVKALERIQEEDKVALATHLPKGKVIGKRWRITKRLGTGSFGAVYKVKNIESDEMAALKVEANRTGHHSVLKLEAHILRHLENCHLFASILQSGKKQHFSYVVMTLLGASLDTLIGKVGKVCTVSTQIRVGINALCAIKALHDLGFIHRDIKPANMAVGVNERSRIIHIFDFGLARQYVIFAKGERPKLRRPRKRARFRGTLRYCSVNAHERGEQGRVDDLWNLLHMLVEMRGRLPWANAHADAVILHYKRRTPPEDLLGNCPMQFLTFYKHLTSLNYYTHPNYFTIYSALEEVRRVAEIKYSDPYDWEFQEFLRLSEEEPQRRKASIRSLEVTQSSCAASQSDHNPFPSEFFTSNPLGF